MVLMSKSIPPNVTTVLIGHINWTTCIKHIGFFQTPGFGTVVIGSNSELYLIILSSLYFV